MAERDVRSERLLVIALLLALGFFGWTQGALANVAALLPLLLVMANGQLWRAISLPFVSLAMLLLVALALHQVPLIIQGLVPLYEGIKAMSMGLAVYCAGYALAGQFSKRPIVLVLLILAGSSGFVGLSIVSAVYSGFPLKMLALPGYAINPLGQFALHKTHVGMFSSLGMCLAPAVLFWWPDSWRLRLVWLAMLVLVVAGFAANMALQNRTPVIAMMVVMVLGATIYMRDTFAMRRSVLWYFSVLVGISVAAIVATWLLSVWWDTLLRTAFLAFDRMALATPRYKVWATVFEHFGDHFWGGRKIQLPENYAHNLWLDVLWDSGLLAFVAWVIFHSLHLIFCIGLMSRAWPRLLRLVLLGSVGSIYLSALVEPVVGASLFYFWLGLMVLGICARLALASSQQTEARGLTGTHGVLAGQVKARSTV